MKSSRHLLHITHRFLQDTGTPHILMDINKLRELDLYNVFSSSYCVLVSYNIKSIQDLSTIIDFGRTLIHQKRLSLLLKLGTDLTLEMAVNTSNLPYLVAAELDDGREQFLCPIIGNSMPRLQETMCNYSYTMLKNKDLRVVMFGIPPYTYSITKSVFY